MPLNLTSTKSLTQRLVLTLLTDGRVTNNFAQETRSVGIVIAANKIDLEASREVSIKEGQSLAAKLGVAFVECSAKTRQNVVQLFTTLVQEMDRVSVTREVPQKPTKEKVAPTSTAHSTSPTTPKISKKKSSSGFGCFGRKRSKSEPASEMKDIIVKHL
jgi:GTPase SAR1 family protein